MHRGNGWLVTGRFPVRGTRPFTRGEEGGAPYTPYGTFHCLHPWMGLVLWTRLLPPQHWMYYITSARREVMQYIQCCGLVHETRMGWTFSYLFCWAYIVQPNPTVWSGAVHRLQYLSTAFPLVARRLATSTGHGGTALTVTRCLDTTTLYYMWAYHHVLGYEVHSLWYLMLHVYRFLLSH